MSHILLTLCALLFGVSLVAGPAVAQAETLSDVLQRTVPGAPLPPANVQLPITSYATLDDASYFAIGYYLASAADPDRLEPPLRLLALNKRAGTWAHREFPSMETQTRGMNADCLGSVMAFQSVANWFVVTTHLTPSAGCTAILTRELVVKHTLYGSPAASFSSGRMIYQRGEVHFASTHPLELALYDPATDAELSLIPREDDRVWKDLVKDIRDTADLAWCRDHDASCDPETMDGSLEEIKVNNAAQACAFRVYYDAMGYGPKAEDFVGDATVVYIFDLRRGQLRHREFRVDVLKDRFGTVDLEKLIEPAGLQRVFGTPPN